MTSCRERCEEELLTRQVAGFCMDSLNSRCIPQYESQAGGTAGSSRRFYSPASAFSVATLDRALIPVCRIISIIIRTQAPVKCLPLSGIADVRNATLPGSLLYRKACLVASSRARIKIPPEDSARCSVG